MKTRKPILILSLLSGLLILFSSCQPKTNYYTRGVGIYPGKLSEDFSPKLVIDHVLYRNLAKLRPAYHSSSYDYNLTAQLVTDGIIINSEPDYISLSTSQGVVPKNEREWLFDHNSITSYTVAGTDIWLQLEMSPTTDITEITSINLSGNVTYNEKKPGGWQFVCKGSDDGVKWDDLGKIKGNGLPGQERPNPFRIYAPPPAQKGSARRRRPNPFAGFMSGPYGNDSTAPKPSFSFNFRMPGPQRRINETFEFKNPVNYHFYKVSFSAPSVEEWTFGDFDFYNNNTKPKMAPSHDFKSAWMSAGTGVDWVYVDLGSESTFDNVKLYWINKAAKGSVQVSKDIKTWRDVAVLPGNNELTDDIKLDTPIEGRYIRVLMTEPAAVKRFILSELEVYGRTSGLPIPLTDPILITLICS